MKNLNFNPREQMQAWLDMSPKAFLKGIQTLSYREREIVKLRHGFYGEPLTWAEIGRRFKVTRERVRQVYCKSWIKMRLRMQIILNRK